MSRSDRKFGKVGLLVLSLWAALGSRGVTAAPLPQLLIELMSRDVGRSLLGETQAGHALTARLLGHEFYGASDLVELRASLERPANVSIHAELQNRLASAERELKARFRAGPMSLAQRARLLEEVSTRFFSVEGVEVGSPSGEITFVSGRTPSVSETAPSGAGGYESERGFFSRWQLSPRSVGTNFESAIPIEEGSMVARWGEPLYQDLVSLERRYLEENGLSGTQAIADAIRASRGTELGRRQPVTLKQMIDYIVAQRRLLARELSALSTRYQVDEPVLSQTFANASHHVELSPSALERIEAKGVEWAGAQYEAADGKAEPLMDYVHNLRGELGELKVALRVRGLAGRGMKVEQLGVFFGEGPIGNAARAELEMLRSRYPQYLGKELDLILDHGMLWGEVKNYGGVFSEHSRFYDKVMDQAQRTIEIRALLERNPAIARALRALGKTIRFRIYFVGGVTEGAAQKLEQMGFEVWGTRYLDPAPAPARLAPAA